MQLGNCQSSLTPPQHEKTHCRIHPAHRPSAPGRLQETGLVPSSLRQRRHRKEPSHLSRLYKAKSFAAFTPVTEGTPSEVESCLRRHGVCHPTVSQRHHLGYSRIRESAWSAVFTNQAPAGCCWIPTLTAHSQPEMSLWASSFSVIALQQWEKKISFTLSTQCKVFYYKMKLTTLDQLLSLSQMTLPHRAVAIKKREEQNHATLRLDINI